ncbi:MAG TPA: hypothetical protein VKA38_02260 [Draconibacterium sp.]|nr:hypothetical protein [Draconibacterium sp.]
MYTGLLHTHSLLRWLVLIAAAVAIAFAFAGWIGKKEWKKSDNVAGLLLTIFIDIQFLVGIILYAFVSPVTKQAFVNFGAAMKNDDLRFYAVEHIVTMIVALAVIHIGRSKSKKAATPVKQHMAAALFYTIGLILILSAIPWDRALI